MSGPESESESKKNEEIHRLEKELKILTLKLEKCERNRAELGFTKDQLDNVLTRNEEARAEIEQKNLELARLYSDLEAEKIRVDKILLTMMPRAVFDELKLSGRVLPKYFKSATVLFADFKSFTQIAEKMKIEDVFRSLSEFFTEFDHIVSFRSMERLKTLGDGYMCAGGIPTQNKTHPIEAILAGLAMQAVVKEKEDILVQKLGLKWEMRIGIHTGPVLAGVVGSDNFNYDVWGDAVNVASRLESAGEPGLLNVSRPTAEAGEDFFELESRGKIPVKSKGEIEMFFIKGLKEKYCEGQPHLPNSTFWKQCKLFKSKRSPK